MSDMSHLLDAARLADLARDPNHVAACIANYEAVRAAHPRLGSPAAMKLEPQSEPAEVDDAIAEMLCQIEAAETALQMARDALEGFGRYPSTLTARSLMNEACGYLAED